MINLFSRSLPSRHRSVYLHSELWKRRDVVVSFTLSRRSEKSEHHIPQDSGSSNLSKASDQAQDRWSSRNLDHDFVETKFADGTIASHRLHRWKLQLGPRDRLGCCGPSYHIRDVHDQQLEAGHLLHVPHQGWELSRYVISFPCFGAGSNPSASVLVGLRCRHRPRRSSKYFDEQSCWVDKHWSN